MTSGSRTVLLALVLIYPFWLAMMAAHELGGAEAANPSRHYGERTDN